MSSAADNSGVIITGGGWVLADRTGSIGQLPDAAESIKDLCEREGSLCAVDVRLADAHPDLHAEIKSDKGAWITAMAIENALAEAGITREAIVPERTGLVIGSALAGQLGMIEFAGEVREQTPRFVSPLHFPQTVGNFVAGAIARAYDFKGPNQTIASGAASGLDAIIEGCELIRAGSADIVLAGVTEVRTESLAKAFADEPGAAIEGACWFVLERAGARQGVTNRCIIHSWAQGVELACKPRERLGPLSGPFALMWSSTTSLGCRIPESLSKDFGLLANYSVTPDGPDSLTAVISGGGDKHHSCLTIRTYPGGPQSRHQV